MVHEIILSMVHKVFFPAVRIELTKLALLAANIQSKKTVISFLAMNIKPTRLTTPLGYIRSLSLQYALSLQDLLTPLQEHTKSTGSCKTTKKLPFTWPLDSSQ